MEPQEVTFGDKTLVYGPTTEGITPVRSAVR